ncbi:MAG TPA: hypothetical protein VGQ20_09460 [Acidimicrobiales bacterium]|nr:hypothetical protein [Acidimicrobiales bacterium]
MPDPVRARQVLTALAIVGVAAIAGYVLLGRSDDQPGTEVQPDTEVQGTVLERTSEDLAATATSPSLTRGIGVLAKLAVVGPKSGGVSAAATSRVTTTTARKSTTTARAGTTVATTATTTTTVPPTTVPPMTVPPTTTTCVIRGKKELCGPARGGALATEPSG